MFKTIRLRKLNNKGLSLVEVLVALAITGIVATIIMSLISSGTGFYRRQSNSIDLQNELQETSNKISDALMEATQIEVTDSDGMLVIKTGNFSEENAKVQPKCIVWVKPYNEKNGAIYVMDTEVPASFDEAAEGYCMSECVEDFSIEIDESCLKTDESGHVQTDASGNEIYRQPVMFNVSIKVSDNGEEKHDSKTITLRNRIDKLIYMGNEYNVSSR